MVVVIVGKDVLCGIYFLDKYFIRCYIKVMWDEGIIFVCL